MMRRLPQLAFLLILSAASGQAACSSDLIYSQSSSSGVGASSSTSTSASGTASGGGCGGCGGAWKCCGESCVAPDNDLANCGKCGNVCEGANPYCDHGTCAAAPPCTPDAGQGACAGGFCCGGACCAADELCCTVPSNTPSTPKCVAPVGGTCPKGCNLCP